jgi:hypothetical protein
MKLHPKKAELADIIKEFGSYGTFVASFKEGSHNAVKHAVSELGILEGASVIAKECFDYGFFQDVYLENTHFIVSDILHVNGTGKEYLFRKNK